MSTKYKPVWEDILQDYLEIAWELGSDQTRPILQTMRRAMIRAEAIRHHPAISLDDHLILRIPRRNLTHVWFFDEGTGGMIKIKLPQT